MKAFIKYVLATIVGIVLSFVLITVTLICGLVGLALLLDGDATPAVAESSVFELNLSGTMVDYNAENELQSLLKSGSSWFYDSDDETTISLHDIRLALIDATTNENVKLLYIKAGALSATPAQLQELRSLLKTFKSNAAKPIITYADNYTLGTYYVCSLADKVVLNPKGSISWMGMSSSVIYFKDLLDKLGVGIQVFKVGQYKAAVEPYISNQMSEANRTQITAYLKDIWQQLVDEVAESRNISAEMLNTYADEVLSFMSCEELLARHMVDTLCYKTDMNKLLNAAMQRSKDDKVHKLSLTDMMALHSEDTSSENIVAVYYAEGDIDSSTSFAEGGINSNKVCKDLRKLYDDDNVKALVLRVNSPGGSAFASEQLWHEVERFHNSDKTVVVSMGGYAASGGYYMSCAADMIVALPATITGSIGIFGVMPNVANLYDKIGIHSNVVNTNTHADMLSINRPLNSAEEQIMQRYVNEGYELFVQRCSTGRNISTDSIKAIAQGRVWTGRQAESLGLVDFIGGIDTAIMAAVVGAQLEDYSVEYYPEVEDWFTTLTNGLSSWQKLQSKAAWGECHTVIELIERLRTCDKLQTRLPYLLHIDM